MYTANKTETFHPAYRCRHGPSRVLVILCLLISGLFYFTTAANTANAATYYCDPVNGDTSTGDGSVGNPWGTLESIFTYPNIKVGIGKTVVGGDTVKLMTGYHGYPNQSGIHNDGYVTIEPADGNSPTLKALAFAGGQGLILSNLTISPELAPGAYEQVGYLIYVVDHPSAGDAFNIIVEDCNIYSVADVSGWDANAWDANSCGAIRVIGPNCIIRNNTITNVGYGILGGGDNYLAENNTITNFAIDAMRVGEGDDQIWQYNTVKNLYRWDPASHSDGLQVYSSGGAVKNLTIRGNYILEADDPCQPFRDKLNAGIMTAQGFPEETTNWVIENNLLIVSWQGISIENPNGIEIINNTVMRPTYSPYETTYPYIHLAVDSGGPELSNNAVIRNNIAGKFPDANTPRNIEVDHNIDIDDYNGDYTSLFVDYPNYDLHHKEGSPAIDTGSADLAPATDILGVSRVFPPDAGCYEYVSDPNVHTHDLSVSSTTGGTVTNPGEGQFSYDHGSDISIEATADLNYHFVNWTGTAVDAGKVDNPSNASTKVTIDADYSIQANFAIDTFTLDYAAGAGGSLTGNTAQVIDYGSDGTAVTAVPDLNYHFVDWSDASTDNPRTDTNVTATVNVTANFAIDTFTLDYAAGAGGSLTGNTAQVVDYGADGTAVTAVPDTGYHFVDWSDASTDNPRTDLNVTANVSVTANFVIDEEDETAPAVTNLSPQADSIQAPLNSLITLDVVDDGKGVDANSVTINVNDNIVYSGNTATHSSTHGKCHRIGTKANYKFIYQSEQHFEFGRPVSVTVNATDLKSNVMEEYSYSFKTEMRSFGENKKVDLGNLKKGRPVTVRDDSNDIWAAWHAGSIGGSRDIYIGKLLAEAKYFGDSINLTNDANDQCNPVIAVGSDDTLYVAWQDNRRGNWDIYISTSNDWSAEIRVTDSNDNQINPAIVVDSSLPNNAYIVWEDDRSGNQDIYVAKSSDGFATKTVSQITSHSSDQVEPAIAANSGNTIYVVWTDTRNGGKNDIYGAASNNGSWTNVPVVTEEDGQSSPAIATEAVGSILHLVWVDDRTTDGDDDIFYAKTTGGLSPLTGSSIVDDDTGADQISPVIITTGYAGNDLKVFACWRDERNADADLYAVEIGAGAETNVFVGDDGTNSDQSEPAIGIDKDGHPYLVWTNERTDICYAGSIFIDPDELASKNVSTTSEATVGTMRNAIQSVDDVSAELPQGAYLCDVKVTISRIKNPQKLRFDRFTGIYEFGPSGMEFTKPVTITIPYKVNGSENASYKAYWYNSLTNTLSQQGITNVETIVISSNLHALRFKTTHFSPFILGGALGGLLGGGGGGGGCSMSPNSQDSIAELLLPYIGLAVAMVVLKLRDRRKRKAHNLAKS